MDDNNSSYGVAIMSSNGQSEVHDDGDDDDDSNIQTKKAIKKVI